MMPRTPPSRPRLVVIGAGVAGLSAAQTALERVPDLDLHILEQSARIGGLVESERTEEGFLIEHGADSLVTAKPGGLAALERAGLLDHVVAPSAGARATYVVQEGRLVAMPAGLAFGAAASPLSILRSDLLSLRGKVRLALEPWIARRVNDEDESVASFVTRRFGRDFLNNVVAPVLEGVHGASVDELSMRACLPGLRAHEQESGSVARGVRNVRTLPGQRPPVLTLRNGMGSLVDAIARPLAHRIHTSTAVKSIVAQAGGRYLLQLADGATDHADAVIVATPAHVAARLLEHLSSSLASLLDQVRYSRMDCVTLAFPREGWPADLRGSGFVVPRTDPRALRACTWASMKWPGRAPDGFVLTRSLLQGAGMRDDELIVAALREHAELLDVRMPPTLMRLRRSTACLPIPGLGSVERRARIQKEADALGAFALAGNAVGAIGLPDCAEGGRLAAIHVTQALRRSLYLETHGPAERRLSHHAEANR